MKTATVILAAGLVLVSIIEDLALRRTPSDGQNASTVLETGRYDVEPPDSPRAVRRDGRPPDRPLRINAVIPRAP